MLHGRSENANGESSSSTASRYETVWPAVPQLCFLGPTARNAIRQAEEQKITSFGQPISLIALGRASATLHSVIYLCQTKCQRPDRHAHNCDLS